MKDLEAPDKHLLHQVYYILACQINQVFLTSSGQLLWHWTPLPSAKESWTAAEKKDSFLCFRHHCQPAEENRSL